MKPITIFTGSTGLNIVADPVRLPQTENGLCDLQAAVNITIDRTGRPKSRVNTKNIQTGSYHSLFCDHGDCFVIQGDTLYQVATDYSLSIIKTGLFSAPMAYAQVGERTYYTNNYDKGIIHLGKATAWEKETYIGPYTHRQFDGPFPGHHLEIFFSLLLISVDNVLWWSEPANFGLFNRAESFIQFNTKILMMKSVNTGLFISTEKNTYFLSGLDPTKWILHHIVNYPAIEWTCAIDYISASDMGFEQSGKCALWASKEGAIMGTPNGEIINLNKNKIIYPENARTGFGGLFGYNFIHGME